MPKGVFTRTKPVWNKGITKYQGLLDRINWLLLLGQPQTLSQIYEHFNNEISYKKLQWLLSKARAGGIINKELIAEGRGLMKDKGGGLRPKFKIGDKVRIDRTNRRTPQWLRGELRLDIPRIIVATFNIGDAVRRGLVDVSTKNRNIIYYLGSNRMGNGGLEVYGFRSCQLIPYIKGTTGRPRLKRLYNRKNGNGIGNYTNGGNKGLETELTASPSILCVNRRKQGVPV